MLLTARAVADETASPDNWKAITESPQSQPPGFQVNPPVHGNAGGQHTPHRAQPQPERQAAAANQARQRLWLGLRFCFEKRKTSSLPVNDYRVRGCLVSIATTFLVTAPAVEER